MTKQKRLMISLTMALVLLLLGACGGEDGEKPQISNSSGDVNEPDISDSSGDVNEPAPSATPEGLAGYVVGLWGWQDDDGSVIWFDFADDGTLIVKDSEIGSYEVPSDNTILATIDGEELIMRIRDYQNDNLTILLQGEARTYQRFAPVSNLDEAVIGLWALEDEGDVHGFVIEFTADNRFLDSHYYAGQYKVLSGNSVEFFDTYSQKENPDLRIIRQITEVTDDTITFFENPEESFTVSRIEGHQNLAEGLVGLWIDEYGQDEIEFTADGRYISYNQVLNYEVISDNTIMLTNDEEVLTYFNIIDITDDKFSFEEFGGAYTGGYEPVPYNTFTRVKH